MICAWQKRDMSTHSIISAFIILFRFTGRFYSVSLEPPNSTSRSVRQPMLPISVLTGLTGHYLRHIYSRRKTKNPSLFRYSWGMPLNPEAIIVAHQDHTINKCGSDIPEGHFMCKTGPLWQSPESRPVREMPVSFEPSRAFRRGFSGCDLRLRCRTKAVLIESPCARIRPSVTLQRLFRYNMGLK